MDYMDLLTEKTTEFQEKFQSAESIDQLESAFKESVAYYAQTLIPQFFSSRGEGRRIKDMYQKLDEDKNKKYVRESKLEMIDLNMADAIYSDYFTGMRQFILETCDTCIDPELYQRESATCMSKLQTAKENDGKFIQSIFGGTNNKSHIETIVESTKNVEYLVDFIDHLKEQSQRCDEIFEKVKNSANDTGSSLMLESTRLMCESVNAFIHNTIGQIFDSYNRITGLLDGDVVPVDLVPHDGFKIW